MEQTIICLSKEDLQVLIYTAIKDCIKQTTEENNKLNSYYTRQQVMDKLHIKSSTLHNLCTSGRLQKHTISGKPLFLAEEVDNAVKNGTIVRYKHL